MWKPFRVNEGNMMLHTALSTLCRKAVTFQNELNMHADVPKLTYVDSLTADINTNRVLCLTFTQKEMI